MNSIFTDDSIAENTAINSAVLNELRQEQSIVTNISEIGDNLVINNEKMLMTLWPEKVNDQERYFNVEKKGLFVQLLLNFHSTIKINIFLRIFISEK